MNENKCMKKALVIGLGVSGLSAVKFLEQRGYQVTTWDDSIETKSTQNSVDQHLLTLPKTQPSSDRTHQPSDRTHQPSNKTHQPSDRTHPSSDAINTIDLSEMDCIVVSPGVPQKHPLYARALSEGRKVIGEVELACREINQPMIGITGTNGKTTVTLLIEHVLNQAGIPARAVGNVGLPLTSVVDQAMNSKDGQTLPPSSAAPSDAPPTSQNSTVLVCELSSYQLETLYSKVLDVAVILNVTPDHLDRYPDMKAYAAAKYHIINCLKPGSPLYVDDLTAAHFLDKGVTRFICKKNLALLYKDRYRREFGHDLENIMAAFAVCSRFGVNVEVFWRGFDSFVKPAHRIEYVTTNRGVKYYDDSKGTNIDAVVRAVESMDGKVVLIAGGQDKGGGYHPWIEAFKGKVKAICLIGEAKNKIAEAMGGYYPVELCDDMESAVMKASKLAVEGDNVLLSPGCSSFDMFKNYAHRGDVFKEIVLKVE